MAVEFEIVDVWVGDFPTEEAFEQLFKETIDPDDDDTPISQFAEETVSLIIPPVNEGFVFDGAGRMREDAMWNYNWDGAGRLTRMVRKAGVLPPGAIGERVDYIYDADGRRTQKTHTVSYQGRDRVEQSTMLWAGWLPILEIRTKDGQPVDKKWYQWGADLSGKLDRAGGIGVLVAIIEEKAFGGTRTLIPVHDGLGNIAAVIDNATGKTVAKFSYGPFGEPLGASGETDVCPFRYQTKYFDQETEHYYFGYRYLNPRLGRWLNRDPMGEAGGFNVYGYCGNDPVNRWDYLGMWDEAGTIRSFAGKYGNNPKAIAALFAVLSRYSLQQGNFWFDDWSVNHRTGGISIASNSGLGWERSNENAADQLYQILADDSQFYKVSGLSETWGGFGRRVTGGVAKTAGGGFSVLGGGVMMAVPEPTLLTKVGGTMAIGFGTNTMIDGTTQIFNGRDGGINLMQKAAWAYGNAMAGTAGGDASAYWIGWAEFAGGMGGAIGNSAKWANIPIRQVPGATADVLKNAFTSFKGKFGPAPLAPSADLAVTPLANNVVGVADDALVHFAPQGYSVIKPGAGGHTFTFRYGDIKDFTPRQIEFLVGPLAHGGTRGGARVMHVLDTPLSSAVKMEGGVVSEFSEYILTQPTRVINGFIVQ